MTEHGHEEYVRSYVLHETDLADVPLGGIECLLARAPNDEERRTLLRRAIQVWRSKEQSSFPGQEDQFSYLFRAWWRVLPRDEALTTLREIIDHIFREPDSGVSGRISDVHFTSMHALQLFEAFDVLGELDPERAQQMVRAHPELSTALERYPKGMRSIEEEAEIERSKLPPRDPNQRGGFIIAGSRSEDFDYARALIDSQNTGDFTKPLAYAAARYREDTDPENPNNAPKAFWPSGAMYQTIFYEMGKLLGRTAEQKLDSVPDAELRVFAQIELAAACCGLPQLSSLTQQMPNRRARPTRNW